MIMTVEELRQYINTNETDAMLKMKLSAIELMVRKYTNNNFQNRGFRIEADIRAGVFMSESLIPFDVGDTIMASESDLQSGCLAVVTETNDFTFLTDSEWADDSNILVTKVVYPADVKIGVINLMKWELNNRDKVGIQSETISRHSVTYADANGDNYVMGYPKSLIGFLKPYMKARF
jgi:hypothetical protein